MITGQTQQWTLDWDHLDVTSGKTVLTTIDAHTAGEPLRIVTSGLQELPGDTMLDRRRYVRDHLDHVRRTLMFEPRGHSEMYGAIVTPPISPDAHVGVLFMHHAGYSTMCGHGIIALVTVLIETGAIEPTGQPMPINIDTPAGLVRASAHVTDGGRVERVSFLNVPSFVLYRDRVVDLPGHGPVTVDIAFGGAFYAILPAERVGLSVSSKHTRVLVDLAKDIKLRINEECIIEHPFESDLSFLYGVLFTGKPEAGAHHSRNLCEFADGQIDRSPTGTGVSARAALHHARGELHIDQRITIESILGAGSTMTVRVVEATSFGPHTAIVPEVTGGAHITGRHEFITSPNDKLGGGFAIID